MNRQIFQRGLTVVLCCSGTWAQNPRTNCTAMPHLLDVGAPQAPQALVTICVNRIPNGRIVVEQAQMIATSMFAAIGVPIRWHSYGSCPGGQGEIIRISLTTQTPRNYFPDAFAYSQPFAYVQAFKGSHVRVFFDRVERADDFGKAPVRSVMAHVLAHEITHILKGTNDHSPSGVMKARWGSGDYRQMAEKPLAFTEEDITAIHNGFAARARWAAR